MDCLLSATGQKQFFLVSEFTVSAGYDREPLHLPRGHYQTIYEDAQGVYYTLLVSDRAGIFISHERNLARLWNHIAWSREEYHNRRS